MANASETPKPDEVGWLFVQQYYTMMNKKPGNLHLFYKSKSSFVHGTEGETVKLSQGQQEIHDRISDLNLKECRVLVSNVDSQASLEGGILIQVLGEISNDGQESRKFAQTFNLGPQESGFYVYNDIFRFLKEDVESIAGDELHMEPNSASAQSPEVMSNGAAAAKETSDPAEPKSLKQESSAQSPDPVSETAQEAQATTPAASKAVNEIEKAAAEPVHAPAALAQSANASPLPTPQPAEQVSEPAGSSSAVEAVAEPAPEKAAEPAKSAAPLSWAARAAANGASKALAGVTKVVAPKATPAKSTTPVVEGEKKVAAPSNAAVADVTRSAFLKNINAKMTDDAIRASLKKFGDFKNVEINRAKSCGFVDYLEASSCAAAIKFNRVSINGEILYVEERRRDSNGKIGPKEKRYDQARDTRGEATRGGRGGSKGAKAGRGPPPAK